MTSDLRQAIRTLLKSPGFSAIIVIVLAAGIGATTAIFSIVNGVLLAPLPFADAARIVSIESLVRGEPDQTSNPDLQDWRAAAKTVDSMSAWATVPVSLTGRGEAAVISSAAVTGDFFQLLGVTPLAGRVLAAEDDRAGAASVAVISESLWASRFSRDAAIIGQTLTLDGQPVAIVGVMPAAFDFPIDSDTIQLWLPVRSVAFVAQYADQRGASFLHVIGRLRADTRLEQAQAEMTTIAARIAREYPKSNAVRSSVLIRPLRDKLVHEYRLALIVLLTAVGAVLLIACANVANLLLARGAGRHKEMAIRAALGAGRGRLVRQLLTESVLLAGIGGGLGVLLALWGVAALVAASPIEIPRLHAVHVDRGVLLFALALSVLTGVAAGLAPALQASGSDAGDTLKDAGRGTSGSRSGRTRQILVVAEVALSVVLLASAGLLVRSLVALQRVDPGFVAAHAVGMQLSLPDKKYPTAANQIAFYRRLVGETRAIPGVIASGAATTLPLSGSDIGMGFSIEGQPATSDPATRPSAVFFGVSPEYFHAMGIRVVRGRVFTERDDEHAPNVAIVSESFVKRYWPNDDPIGHRMTINNGTGAREIVGIVSDVKQGDLAEKPPLEMYAPFPQAPWPFVAAVARTLADPAAITAGLRAALTRIDPEQPAAEIKLLDDYVARAVATPRFTALLVGSFATMALLLAGFGLFSVMAYSVAQRGREIGIRMALGAQPSNVRSLVVTQALRLGGIGLALGLVGALAATRVLDSLLFGISANDPVTFTAVCAALLSVLLLAAYLPARRATHVDPMIALRTE